MTDDERRLLELLAGSDLDGCTDVLLLTRGFALEMIADMVRAGLAIVEPGRVLPGGGVEHTRLWIKEAGRRARPRGEQRPAGKAVLVGAILPRR